MTAAIGSNGSNQQVFTVDVIPMKKPVRLNVVIQGMRFLDSRQIDSDYIFDTTRIKVIVPKNTSGVLLSIDNSMVLNGNLSAPLDGRHVNINFNNMRNGPFRGNISENITLNGT